MSIAYITNLTTYNKKRTFFFVIIVNIFAKDSSTVEQNIFNIFSVKLIELKSFFSKGFNPFLLEDNSYILYLRQVFTFFKDSFTLSKIELFILIPSYCIYS